MTRKEIEALYNVENGIIRSPGKFEGEPVYAPHIWDMVLNDDYDTLADTDEADGAARVYITPEDVEEFPELDGEPFIEAWEDYNGFVHTR